MLLQEDALNHVLGYVGPKNYIFIASVCSQWKRHYRLVHGPEETRTSLRSAVASSLSTLRMYKEANRNPSSRASFVLHKKIGENGDIQIVQWLQAHKQLTLSRALANGAAYGGHLGMLKWLRANGCPWDDYTCHNAAKGGHLELLKWARANGCPWDKYTTYTGATYGGHLELLKWARTNGCPWDEYTCSWAAKGGHLELLKWARTNGCPLDKYTTCTGAASGGHLELFRPCNVDDKNDATLNNAEDRNFLREVLCVINETESSESTTQSKIKIKKSKTEMARTIRRQCPSVFLYENL